MRVAGLGSMVLGFVLVPGVALACGGSSDGGHNHGASQHHATTDQVAPGTESAARHGGYVLANADIQYEIAGGEGEVRIYAYDVSGEAVDLRGVNGVLRSTGGPDSDKDAVLLTYKSLGRGQPGWLSAALPARETPPAPGEYRIVLRDLPSRQVREVGIVWPPEVPVAAPRSSHSTHQH